MTHRYAFIFLAALVVGTPSAQERVVTVHGLQGQVLVNQVEFYLPAREGQVLQAGDRVLVLPGASMRLTYGEHCVRRHVGPALVSVDSPDSCSGVATNQAMNRQPMDPVPFDGVAFLARVGGLGHIEGENFTDSYGP